MSLTKLFSMLDTVESESVTKAQAIKDQIQLILNKQFDDWQALQKSIGELSEYKNVNYYAEFDGIYSFVRCNALNDIDFNHREYLENYMSEQGYTVNFEHDTISQYLGDDNLMIQDDTRLDNGVWQGHKKVIDEQSYTNDDGDIDIELRNELIEKHMNNTGHFPGVFRITGHGDVFPVDTQAKG